MLLEFCLEKELCVSNTWYKRGEGKKVTFRNGYNETKLTLSIKKENRRFMQSVKTIPWEF